MNREIIPIEETRDDDWETVIFEGEDTQQVNHDFSITTTSPNSEILPINLSFVYDSPKKQKNKSTKRSKSKKKKKQSDVLDLAFCCRDFFDVAQSIQDIGKIPEYMNLTLYRDGGVFFGKAPNSGINCYIGKPQDYDGHILVVGGQGSHKSSGIAIPTLEAWDGVIVALDVKGELSQHWQKKNRARRSCKIFSPDKPGGATYDPLYHIRNDNPENLFSNVCELVEAIIPLHHSEKGDFWINAARDLLIASIIYYLDLNLNFIEIIKAIVSRPMTELISEICHGTNLTAKTLVNQYRAKEDLSDSEMLFDVLVHLNLFLRQFAADIKIQNAFVPTENTIKWDEDIDTRNIFLSIPECKLSVWGSVVNLMLTQLIRTLERRPEKYSSEGQNLPPILLLLDEFPRYGKLEMITDALATLRSKGVTFCLFIQSLAQLDYIYGKEVTRIILDLCNYKALLSVNDMESQKVFSDLIGSSKVWTRSFNENFDPYSEKYSYSRSMNETRESIIQPHELATLNDSLVLLTPNGYCKINKAPFYKWRSPSQQLLSYPILI